MQLLTSEIFDQFLTHQIKALSLDLHCLSRRIKRHDQSIQKIKSNLVHCTKLLRQIKMMKLVKLSS